VKWHHTTFPRLERGFDSRHPLIRAFVIFAYCD
jgi:hypothetical protein